MVFKYKHVYNKCQEMVVGLQEYCLKFYIDLHSKDYSNGNLSTHSIIFGIVLKVWISSVFMGGWNSRWECLDGLYL